MSEKKYEKTEYEKGVMKFGPVIVSLAISVGFVAGYTSSYIILLLGSCVFIVLESMLLGSYMDRCRRIGRAEVITDNTGDKE